jgi:hypothetical protein
VIACLAGAAAVHAAYLLLAGITEHLDTDDPFIYFEIARNLARDGRLTFDGLSLTNGVQPLWAMLLAAVAWVLPGGMVDDSVQLMLAFKFVASGVSLLTGYLLFRLGYSIAGSVAGLLALFTWVLSPYIFRRDLIGFESSIYALTLVAAVLAYRRRTCVLRRAGASDSASCLGSRYWRGSTRCSSCRSWVSPPSGHEPAGGGSGRCRSWPPAPC